jgi:integrase
LEKELVKKILGASNEKYKAFFLGLASTGMRVNEMLKCSTKWIDLEFYKQYDILLIRIPAIATKETTERFTFASKEATIAMMPYIVNRIRAGRIFDMELGTAEQYMAEIREKIGFTERYETNFHKLSIHSFRSFTRTVLSDHCGLEFAYYLLGQTGYLSQYYRKGFEEAANLYKKAEPFLTIQDM